MTKDTNTTQQATVSDLLQEDRIFSPPETFQKSALINDQSIYKEAENDRIAYWEKCAEQLDWYKKWDTTLSWEPPFAKWFIGGKLNACYNCLDRHIKNGLGQKIAILWEGEAGESLTLSYYNVYKAVNKMANAIKSLGVGKGDRVAIYMPMIPEAVFAMLACARIGAIHTVVFGGFR